MKKLQTTILALLFIMGAFHSNGQQNDTDEFKKRKIRYGTVKDFQIDLGLNNYLDEEGNISNNNELYTVRPFGSWYVALRSVNDTHIAGRLHMQWAADVSWYNFKFENESVRIGQNANQIEFTEANDGSDFVKSKLTAAYVNASLVPMLRFGERRRYHRSWGDCFDLDFEDEGGFRIGAGAYIGYRIASHTKYVFHENNDRIKNRDRDDFFLNNVRYGVRAQFGYRRTDFFVNYDMNELFQEGKGPRLSAFSFGVII